MNALNPENKNTIQNHAIKLYSKIKIKKGKTLEKFGKPYVKGYITVSCLPIWLYTTMWILTHRL